MYRLMIGLVITISCFPHAHADTEYEGDLPLPLVRALIGTAPYGELNIYSDINSNFPELSFPSGFTVLGSMDRGYGITVVFETELDKGSAISAMSDVLQQADYSEHKTQLGSDSVRRGFVTAEQPVMPRYERFCHDTQGFITLSVEEYDDYNTVALASSSRNGGQTCAEQLALLQQQMAMHESQIGLRAHLPILLLPTNSRPIPAVGFVNFSGSYTNSPRAVDIKADLSVDWDIKSVFEHFSIQMAEQGWTADSQNVGAASAIGSWMLSPKTDFDLVGTLLVLKSGDDSFELKFQLNSTGEAVDTSPLESSR